MKPEQITVWANAISALLTLGAPIAAAIAFLKASLAPEDVDAILRQVLAGWQAAREENDARIAELQTLVAAGA